MPWGETEHGAVWMVSGRMGAAGLKNIYGYIYLLILFN